MTIGRGSISQFKVPSFKFKVEGPKSKV